MAYFPLLGVYRLGEIDTSVEQRISFVSPVRGKPLELQHYLGRGYPREAFSLTST
jgi:hypothetical protein